MADGEHVWQNADGSVVVRVDHQDAGAVPGWRVVAIGVRGTSSEPMAFYDMPNSEELAIQHAERLAKAHRLARVK
jgi:hypothetical protein